MKKCSNFYIRVLNMAATLLFAFVLLIGNVVSVRAYTDMNGYPFVLDDMDASIYVYQDGYYDYGFKIAGQLQEQNSYLFDNIQAKNVDGVKNISFGNLSSSFIVPFNTDVYDYYVVGTIAYTNSSSNDFGEIKNVNFYSETSSGNHWVNTYGLDTMLFENYSKVFGQSFYSKLGDIVTSNISSMMITFDEYSVLSAGSDIWFSASIVPVAKSGTEADTLNSILQTLNSINQNLITNNTLQQQTIDAINANTNNNTNWFSTLFSNLSTWYTGMTDNLRTWLYMLDDRLNTGFSNLYNQMTKEQDEKLNGYQDTTQSDAANKFSSESDKLTALEGELSTQGNDFVNDYTSEGFDLGVLSSIGSSLVFVATWFANFWNMGGIFTQTLNMCFALSIVFFIFRIKR